MLRQKTHKNNTKQHKKAAPKARHQKKTTKPIHKRFAAGFSTDVATKDTADVTTTTQKDTEVGAPGTKLRPDIRHTFVNAISDEMLVSLSMNFNNSGRNHTELCDNLKKNSLVSTPLIEYAFRKCDRKFFDPSLHPYEDKPHDIGGGATITAAHMHAIALESLGDSVVPVKANASIPTKTFLDVGSGSGFVVGVFGTIINALRVNQLHKENALKSKAFGIEIHQGLVEQSLENIRACNRELVDDEIVQMINQDAFSLTAPMAAGPFDAIHCGVAVDYVPLSLLAQLKPGGRIAIPIRLPNSHEQDLYLFTRKHVVDSSVVAEDEDIYTKACDIQKSNDVHKITEFLDTFFTRKAILRCVYQMAHTDSTVPTNMPAINTAEKQKQNQVLAGFFNKDDSNMTPEQKAKAQQEVTKAKQMEKEAKIHKYQQELNEKTAELDSTSSDIKKWHSEYVAANNGKKPSLKEMNADHKLNNLLLIVKELRIRIGKLERAIVTLQSDEQNQPKKH